LKLIRDVVQGTSWYKHEVIINDLYTFKNVLKIKLRTTIKSVEHKQVLIVTYL